MYKNFHHQFDIQIRFSDLDTLNHVNNAVFLTYVEQARIDYFKAVGGVQVEMGNEGVILAKATVEFRQPIYLEDKITIFTRCSRLGNKSFDLEYELAKVTHNGYVLAALATTVQVTMNYTTHQTIVVPDSWRKSLLTFEGVENLS